MLCLLVSIGFILWMFWDFLWPQKKVIKKQLGKADEPIEYNFKHVVRTCYKELWSGKERRGRIEQRMR